MEFFLVFKKIDNVMKGVTTQTTRQQEEQWLLPGGRKIHYLFEDSYLVFFKRIVIRFYSLSFPFLQCIHGLTFLMNVIITNKVIFIFLY